MKFKKQNLSNNSLKFSMVIALFLTSCYYNYKAKESDLIGKWEVVDWEKKTKSESNPLQKSDSIEKTTSVESLKTILETLQSTELNLQSNGTFKLKDLFFLYVDTIIPVRHNGTWEFNKQKQLLILKPKNNIIKKYKVKFLSRNEMKLEDTDKKINPLFIKKTVWRKYKNTQ